MNQPKGAKPEPATSAGAQQELRDERLQSEPVTGKPRVTSSQQRDHRTGSEKNKELESMLGVHRTRIRVVGCGGAGNNTVSRLMEVELRASQTLAINTDAQDLLYANADEKILIGRNVTSGLGAGSVPQIGEESARENLADIEEALRSTDMVFVTCGLGGGTGTGSAPVVAEVAKKLGALTISIVTLPFTEEGVVRWENALSGLANLRKSSDTVIVIQNDRLLEIVPDLPLNEAFRVADEILVNAVKGITELVTTKGLVNLDFADVRTIMRGGGTAMIGMGESEGTDAARQAVQMALQNPLLEVNIEGARNALINIAGGLGMSLKDAKMVMKSVAEKLDPGAKVIWGARIDEALGKRIRVMLVITGLREGDYAAPLKSQEASQQSNASVISVEREIARPAVAAPKQTPVSVIHEVTVPDKIRKLADFDEPVEEMVSKSPAKNKPIFRRLFEEETQNDLKIFRDSLAQLLENHESEEALRGLRSAAQAMTNSAQLFAFNKIADYTGALEEICERALDGELRVTPSLAESLADSPGILGLLIYDDPEATAEVERHSATLRRLADLSGLEMQTAKSQNAAAPATSSKPVALSTDESGSEDDDDGEPSQQEMREISLSGDNGWDALAKQETSAEQSSTRPPSFEFIRHLFGKNDGAEKEAKDARR